MFPTPQHEKIASIVDQVLNREGELYLVEVEIAGTKIPTVWIYLESQAGGISLDACAAVSRELSVLLDAHQVFEGAFRLNVSSPGLDRPLRKMRQYQTNTGRQVKVTRTDGLQRNVIKGTLTEATDTGITVKTEQEIISIPFTEILETKVLPLF